MPNPFRWYRTRRHAREVARFHANLAAHGITDADLARIAEDIRAAFATLPSAEDVAKGMQALRGAPDAT